VNHLYLFKKKIKQLVFFFFFDILTSKLMYIFRLFLFKKKFILESWIHEKIRISIESTPLRNMFIWLRQDVVRPIITRVVLGIRRYFEKIL
jgi:hypothetical protein